MAYDNFTTQQLFANGNTNAFCNRLYTLLNSKDVRKIFDTSFAISGTVSKIIQGATVEPHKVIAFITNDLEIYKYCASQLSIALQANTIAYADRIQFYHEDVFFELWFTSAIGTLNTVDGFVVQATADIPLNIL